MHSPNYKKAVCLFYKPAFNFLSIYCRCNCSYSVGVGGTWFVGFNCSLSGLEQKLENIQYLDSQKIIDAGLLYTIYLK